MVLRLIVLLNSNTVFPDCKFALARQRWLRRPGAHSRSERLAMLQIIAALTVFVNSYLIYLFEITIRRR